MNSYKYTERFLSFQGEGTHTGKNTLWLRWFQCNLECNGFGQSDPTNPETYDLPYQKIDITDITDLTQLPVFERGCDSAYSWAKKYRHLAYDQTPEEIASELTKLLQNERNPEGKFLHPHSGEYTHMCFTGGEPMMRHSQRGIMETLDVFAKQDNSPRYITIETNGTQKLSPEFVDWFSTWDGREWFWSISPKLFNTSGEHARKAIKPEVIKSYQDLSPTGHLKFVVNGTQATWDELEETVKLFREHGIEFPVWIMPVGATKESQEDGRGEKIVYEALSRGYHISGRLHCHLLGNKLGT